MRCDASLPIRWLRTLLAAAHETLTPRDGAKRKREPWSRGKREMGNVVEAGLARTRNNHLIDVKDEDWGRSPFASIIDKSLTGESEHGALCVLELSLSGVSPTRLPASSTPYVVSRSTSLAAEPRVHSVILIRQFLLCDAHTLNPNPCLGSTPHRKKEKGKRKVRN